MARLLGQDFDRDLALQLRVAGTVHLTHSAFAEQRRDFVRAELLTNLKGHQLRLILWKRN